MSVIFSDGFDYYADPTIMVWDSSSGNGVASCAPGSSRRNGGQGLTLGSSSQGRSIYKNIPVQTQLIMGLAVYLNSTALCSPISLLDLSGNVQVSLAISSGVLQVYRGDVLFSATAIGSSYSSVSSAAWHYLEMDCTIGSGTSGSFTVWLDGVQVITASGLNTQGGTGTTIAQVRIEGPASTANYFDDVYICSTAGSFNNSRLGDVSVIGQIPNGNGTQNNFTKMFAAFANSTVYAAGQTISDGTYVQRCTTPGNSQASGTPTWNATLNGTTTSGGATFTNEGVLANWLAVSEVPPDDNSSYVTDATVSDQDRYTYPSISGSQVFAVSVKVRAEKDDSGTRTIRMVTKSGSTVADNGVDFGLSQGSYAYYQGIFESDPNTGVAWTVSGVNAAEFGVKTTA